MSVRKPILTTTTIACLTALTSTSFASGFRVPEITVTGTATSNALVANTEEVGAIAYNPASMSFHDTPVVQLGVNHISYKASVTPQGGTATDSTGEDSFLAPNVTLMIPGDSMSFGLMINSPFGLETKWPNDTFPPFATVDALEPETSRIKMFNVNPNIAFKIDDTSSFAVGLDFYDLQELVFNTYAVGIKGDGHGVGWNLGYQKKLGKFTLGLSYRSSVKTDIKGTFDTTSLTAPNGPFYIGANAELEFPDLLQAGIQFQVLDNLSLELDVERTGWSSFDKITVTNSAGTTLTSSTNNWKDSWAYRIGAIYNVTNSTKLMFGYSFDETPQPDSHFSARVPDADRQLFSVGVSHQFTNKWVLEAAYMYVDVDSRTINSTTAYNPAANPPQEPNGSTAYNGEYSSDVSLLGVSITIPL